MHYLPFELFLESRSESNFIAKQINNQAKTYLGDRGLHTVRGYVSIFNFNQVLWVVSRKEQESKSCFNFQEWNIVGKQNKDYLMNVSQMHRAMQIVLVLCPEVLRYR